MAEMDTGTTVTTTLDQALDPRWLSQALHGYSGGREVVAVETVEVLRTMATKARFTVRFAGDDAVHAFCLKAFLDVENPATQGGATTVLEADFYTRVAPHVAVRVPSLITAAIDRSAPLGLIIMRDLISEGARFCTALEAFTADETAQSLEQIAELHAGKALLERYDWIQPRAGQLARSGFMPAEVLQGLLDGPRGRNISPAVRNAARLLAGVGALADRDESREQFLVHGDSHAGNIYSDAQGRPGLIDWQLLQRGGWALDVAYHVNAVLDVDVAATEERRLLAHYLGIMRGKGFAMPDDETAWAQYREAAIYGYFLWAITRRVDPPIIELFVDRLGQAVTRLESHALLGIA